MLTLDTFYKSREWESLVGQIKLDRLDDNGQIICECCGKPITRKYDCIGHHKIELDEQNVNDYSISLNPDNIMLVHFRCHNRIHSRFDGFRQQVYLVYGPPCAGKSTWVQDVCNKDETINITMSKSDVGLSNVDNVQQYSASNPPPYPVTSVNSKTGAVSLSASDVGALPSNTTYVSSVNGNSGAITGIATSNPNLLINSNFAINQRNGYYAKVNLTPVYSDAELTTSIGTLRSTGNLQGVLVSSTAVFIQNADYATSGGNTTGDVYVALSNCVSGYVGAGYTVDRWRILNGKVVPTSSGVTATPLTTACQFNQLLELDTSNQLDGKTLTLSCSCNGTVYSASGTLTRNSTTSL